MISELVVVIVIALAFVMATLLYMKRKEFFGGSVGYFQIDWEAPASSGKAPIDFYTVLVNNSNGVQAFKHIVKAPTTTTDIGKSTITDGEWGEDYTVLITATNKNGKTGPPGSLKFNSGKKPVDPNSMSYTTANSSPITTATDPSSTLLFSVKIGAGFPGDNMSGGLQLIRDGSVVCKLKSTSQKISTSGGESDIVFSFDSCPQGFGGFQVGDVLKGTIFNFANVQSKNLSWTDPDGYIVPTPSSKAPSKVQGITAKFVYP